MTNTEQMTTIQELSDVISHQMGLREQLEVIRIMNPRANVLHTDTEFVIGKSSIQKKTGKTVAGWPHSSQDKIPWVFPVLPIFSLCFFSIN